MGGKGLAPWVMFPLLLPYGMAGGYVIVTIPYMLSQAGLATAGVAKLIAIAALPDTFKLLWAPLLESVLGPKRWYGLGLASICGTLVLLGFMRIDPHAVTVLTALIFGMSVASTLISMAGEIIMARDVAAERRGRAAGWFQAGYLGGVGLGGGVGLAIA